MGFQSISYEVKENYAYIGFGANTDKSMPVLDEQTLTDLRDAIEQVHSEQKNLSGLILFSHKNAAFTEGADISLIAAMKTEADAQAGAEAGQQIFNRIEDLSIPSIACVHGFCLGGGMEMALSCNYIIGSDSSKTSFGLPEVKLGLIPGFGGTYRMPRRVGLPKALDLILSGRMIKSKKAKRMGLIDGVYPQERLLTMAITHLKSRERKASLKETLENLASDNLFSRKIIFDKASDNVMSKIKGFYHAPIKILDTMENGMNKGRSSYLAS